MLSTSSHPLSFSSMPSKSSRSPFGRLKIRKPKYISIRRHFKRSADMNNTVAVDGRHDRRHHQQHQQKQKQQQQQLDLFPLHPDHDRDPHVAYLLDSGNGGGIDCGAPNLTDLLGGSSASSSPASSPLDWDGGSGGGVDGDGLARKALRGRERWVYCCSSSSSEEEVASGAAAASGIDHHFWCGLPLPPLALSLKLDYEVILTAWSGRGSLYIDGDGPQVVPEIYQAASPVLVEVGSTSTGTWSVPDQKSSGGDRTEEEKAAENREARVKRYKEKRQSRLFAKRIRYEVRKLNAEKRPRLKGRFVKAKDDM